MILRETKLAGAFIMELEKFEDDRGVFARFPSNDQICPPHLDLLRGSVR
jgi:dTDP-4-dehydrorhamnose 3,5-epimerase-like enzyme